MTLNIDQKQWLRNYLYQVMHYRETFEEVYDHILLALEKQPESESFETLVGDIIQNDFGCNISLRLMEDKCRVAAIKKVKAQYRDDFMRWFKSAPLLVSVVATFLLLNYIAIHSFITVEVILGVIILVPEIIFIARRIKSGYLFGDAKASLRDAILKKMSYVSILSYWWIAWWLLMLSQLITFLFSIPKRQAHYVDQFVITVYTVLFIIRAITMFKLFKDDIELSLNQ